MAKQKSMHKIQGKADGRSYFYSQNGGYQSRAINPGMSERVKTAPEYANTRRNNAEYGVAAQIAGSVISTFSGHWRFLLHKNITGKMIKDVYAMITSNNGIWGHRSLMPGQIYSVIPLLNKYCKHSLVDEADQEFTNHSIKIKGAFRDVISINDNAGLYLPAGWGEKLRAAGATGCVFQLVAMQVPNIQYVDSYQSYVEIGGQQLKTLAAVTIDCGIEAHIFRDDYELHSGWSFDAYYQPISIGLLCLPDKVIGSQTYTMQKLCSYKFESPFSY